MRRPGVVDTSSWKALLQEGFELKRSRRVLGKQQEDSSLPKIRIRVDGEVIETESGGIRRRSKRKSRLKELQDTASIREMQNRNAEMEKAQQRARRAPRRCYTRFKQDGLKVRFRALSATGPVELCPVGQRGTIDPEPVWSYKGEAIWRVYSSKKGMPYIIVPKVFTTCCSGSDSRDSSKYCERDTCANCWTMRHYPQQGYHWYIQQQFPKITSVVDPSGVHPRGHRSAGNKPPSPAETARFHNTHSLTDAVDLSGSPDGLREIIRQDTGRRRSKSQ